MTIDCRFCGAALSETFVDLGMSPLANSFVPPAKAQAMEPFYPLHAYVCTRCWLVQLGEMASSKAIFTHYLYFSSYSESWLRHCEAYVATMVERLGLTPAAKVVEVASNDGYLLQYFQARGIPVLGVEPARNVAEAAIAAGIPTEIAFFGHSAAQRLAAEDHSADLIAANNVLAHVPDINDFVRGLKALLKPRGTITVEFPHLLELMRGNQFDTIYHEHFSYLSFDVAERIFARHGLVVFDVDELPTHGGSLRIYARHTEDTSRAVGNSVAVLRRREHDAGLESIDSYRDFQRRVAETKCELLSFLLDAFRSSKRIVGYGAPAKGNTLLNYCGVGPELLAFTVDRSAQKQGMLLPGTRIPIRDPAFIFATKPDYLLILPWNLKDEITEQMAEVRSWGGKFVTAIPRVQVFA